MRDWNEYAPGVEGFTLTRGREIRGGLQGDFSGYGDIKFGVSASSRVRDMVINAYEFGSSLYNLKETPEFERAFNAAKVLAFSGLFTESFFPQVWIDSCGEFNFYLKDRRGTVDIGIYGDGTISYAVTKGANYQLATVGDRDFSDFLTPIDLSNCINDFIDDQY